MVLGAAFERTNSSLIGPDAGELAGIGHIGITVTDNLLAQVGQFDILIDFMRPEGTLSHLAFLSICEEHHKGMMIGTTGFDEEGKKPLIVQHKLFLLSLLLTLVLALI